MARTLTPKRKGFVKDYIETGIGSLAVKRNYDVKDDRSARAFASELLDDPKVKEAIADALPDELLTIKHLALLNKMSGDEIDVQAVSKGLDLAYKLKGSYAPEKSASLNMNIDTKFTQDEQSALLALLNDNRSS